MDDLGGDVCLVLTLDARSVRADETEDDELLCVATLGGGCVVRARDERRGDIVPMAIASLCLWAMAKRCVSRREVCEVDGVGCAWKGVRANEVGSG